MYGLKQAGLLANQLLQTFLAPFGYYLARHTPALWLQKRGQYLSLLWWTISQSSMWASSTQSISQTLYCELMN
jgi:predicted transcriptional regulator